MYFRLFRAPPVDATQEKGRAQEGRKGVVGSWPDMSIYTHRYRSTQLRLTCQALFVCLSQLRRITKLHLRPKVLGWRDSRLVDEQRRDRCNIAEY